MITFAMLRQLYARFSRIQPYIEHVTIPLLGVTLAAIIAALTEPAIPALLKPLLDSGFVNKGLALWKIPVAIIGLFALRGLAGFCAQYFLTLISNNAMQKLRSHLFQKLQRAPFSDLTQTSASALANTIVHEVQSGATQLIHSVLTLLKDSLTLTALLSYLLYLNWQLTLIVFTIIPGVALLIKYFSARLRRIAKAAQKTTDDLAYTVEENFLAQRMIRLHHAQAQQTERFELLSRTLRRLNIKAVMGGAAMTPLTQMLAAIALSVVICVALWQQDNVATVGGFVSFITAMLMLIAPIKHLSEATVPLVRGLTSIERGLDFIDSLPDEATGTAHPSSPQKTASPLLHFADVHLRYGSAAVWALNGIDLSIKAGETIALVGTSGSGKTSLINLLPRFIPYTRGEITLQGVALQDWDLVQLRDQFAYVSQDVVMLNDTLAANVALGDNAPSPARVLHALKAAHLESLLETLPLGMDSHVGHNASQLSGGQRQRLAIARAIYKNAPILLLDEATSALDNESERAVQLALERLMQGRTTIVVAHRLSTIQRADRILVMAQGKIVEAGTHESLLASGQHYYRLHQLGEL